MTLTLQAASACASHPVPLAYLAACSSPKAKISAVAGRLRPSVISFSASAATLCFCPPFSDPRCANASSSTASLSATGCAGVEPHHRRRQLYAELRGGLIPD
jgi:hypothetical protein